MEERNAFGESRTETIGMLLPIIIMTLQMINRLQRTAFHSSHTDWIETTMLLTLADTEGHAMRIGELAGRLSASKSLISERASRLFVMGLATYREDESDRRNVFLVLTEAGEQTVARLIETLRQEILRAFRVSTRNADYVEEFDETPYATTAKELEQDDCRSAIVWIWTHYHELRSSIKKQLSIVPGLTENSFLVLVELQVAGKKMTLNAISEQLLLSKNDIFRVQSFLLMNGYVERERTPEDRRVVQIGLTEKGETLLRAILPVVCEGTAEVLPPMSDEVLAQFSYFADCYNRKYGVRE